MITSSPADGQTVPAFSAVARVTSKKNEKENSFRKYWSVMLYFDGKDKWRLDPNGLSPQDRLPRATGIAIRSTLRSDFFIRDEGRRVLYQFLSRPLTPNVFYHEFDTGPAAPRIPEASGFEDWTIYDAANPCSKSPNMECQRIGTEKVGGYSCAAWRLKWEDRLHRTRSTRTIWLDVKTGITMKSELSEIRSKGRGTSEYKSIVELKDLRIGQQDASLFELKGDDGRQVVAEYDSDDLTSPESSYVFRKAVKEVLVDVAVRDKSGSLISGLSKEDVRIFEDDKERPLAGFWFDEHPLAVALVLDSSSSMASSVHEMQKTAAEVLSRLKPDDEVALLVFEGFVRGIVDLTKDRQAIANALAEVKTVGGTDILNALFISTIYLQNKAPDRRRVIVLVSDNLAPSVTFTRLGSIRTQAELIDTALQNETAIYNLRTDSGGGKSPDLISMERITQATGGMMMSTSKARTMLDDVVSELRKRYVVSFVPARSKPDGRLHTIEITLSDGFGVSEKDYTVHHRSGYRTPQLASTH